MSRVEPPLLKKIPCGSPTCTALVDFVCWNFAFHIAICLFLDLDLMLAQFFKTRLQQFCIETIKYFCRPIFSKS